MCRVNAYIFVTCLVWYIAKRLDIPVCSIVSYNDLDDFGARYEEMLHVRDLKVSQQPYKIEFYSKYDLIAFSSILIS